MSNEVSSKARAESLLEYIQKSQDITKLFGEALEQQYLIHGKPLREWRSHFRVGIPESPDPSQVKMLAARLAALFQEATFLFAAAEAQLDALTSGQNQEFTSHFTRLVTEYEQKGSKLPAEKTLTTIADSNISDIRGAIGNAKIIKNFWKRILEGLTTTRKLLDACVHSNYQQLKQDMAGNIPTNLPNREKYGSNDNE